MTRSMEKLFITHAEMRNLYGSESFNPASRFLQEIPEELTLEVRTGGSVPRLKNHPKLCLAKLKLNSN